MFLKSGEKTLFTCNKRFAYTFYKFTPEFVINFCNCIRKKLCVQVETVKMFGDDIYNKFTVGTLVFKRTVLFLVQNTIKTIIFSEFKKIKQH